MVQEYKSRGIFLKLGNDSWTLNVSVAPRKIREHRWNYIFALGPSVPDPNPGGQAVGRVSLETQNDVFFGVRIDQINR